MGRHYGAVPTPASLWPSGNTCGSTAGQQSPAGCGGRAGGLPGLSFARVTPDEQRILELLVAANHALPVISLRDVPDLVDPIADTLHRLEAMKRIVVDEGGWADVTEEGRQAVGEIGAIRTATVRAALGRLLAGRAAIAPATVIGHRLAGLAVDPDGEVLPEAIEMGRTALRSGDLDVAIGLFTDALAALDHGAEPAAYRVDALGELASALAWAGRRDEAAELLMAAHDAAIRSNDPIQLAATALVWSARAIAVDDDPANTALVDIALHAIEGSDGADPRTAVMRAQLLGLRADRTIFNDLGRARSLAAQALDLAEQTGHPDTIVRNSFTKRLTIWHPSTHRLEGMELANAMVALAPQATGHPEYGAVARLQLFLELGDFEHFDAELRSMRRRVESIRGRFDRVWLETLSGARALIRGDWAAVDEHVTAARELTTGFDYEVLDQLLLAQQMMAGWHRGADLSVLVTRDALPVGPMRSAWSACLLGLSADRLDSGVVERGLLTHLADGIDGIRPDLTWGPVMACLSMAAVAVRSTEHAHLLATELSPYAGMWAATGGAVDFGPFSYHLGRLCHLLGRTEEATAHLMGALDACQSAEAAPWRARAHLALADILDAETGADHSRQAVELAESHGLVPVLAMAGEAGGAPGALPGGLTPREAEVLALVAEGLTNRDIGARLYLSVKTVERHLLNSYTKIGARNRSEATAFVIRHERAMRPPPSSAYR